MELVRVNSRRTVTCNSVRLVCRKWYHMTRTQYFIRTHLEHATYGLLYTENISNDVFFISPSKDKGGIDKYKLNYKITSAKYPSWSRSSCNGLILEDARGFCCYVTNISTGQTFRLPPYPRTLHGYRYSCMGYDVTSMTYKVVISFVNRENRQIEYGIVTVGVDKSWRSVHIDHLSSLANQTIRGCPVVTEGFLVWIYCLGTKVVTLNLETEIMTEASPPAFLLEKEKLKWPVYCLSAGSYLTYVLRRGKFQWKVFEMKPKTAEWRKLSNICLECQKDRIELLGNIRGDRVDINPCGWLKCPEVLALGVRKLRRRTPQTLRYFLIFYNLVTCEIGAENLSISSAFSFASLHKNSLVQFGGPF